MKLCWEIGEAQIHVYCQQYTSHSTSKIKAAIEGLEATIRNTEEGLHGDSDPTTGQLLHEKRLELNSFLQERRTGALVRSCFLQLKDMDAPSSFFLYPEISVAQGKQMTCLRLPRGRATTDPSEMRNHATDLFDAEQCSMECCEELREGLPQLSPEVKAALDCELTLEELKVAINRLVSGRAPGIDGLSSDFYKYFWNTIGPASHGVLFECFRTGSLPVSRQ